MTELVKIFERRVLANVRLTNYQKQVLAMILAAPEGIAPDEDISKGRNLTAARLMLTKLGLITHDGDDKYSVSETGMKVANDEQIIDDSGQLTEVGNKLAYSKPTTGDTMGSGPSGPQDASAPAPFAQTSTEIGQTSIASESFKMLSNLLNR